MNKNFNVKCKIARNLNKLRSFITSLSKEYHLRIVMRHTQNIIVIYYTLDVYIYYIKSFFFEDNRD